MFNPILISFVTQIIYYCNVYINTGSRVHYHLENSQWIKTSKGNYNGLMMNNLLFGTQVCVSDSDLMTDLDSV